MRDFHDMYEYSAFIQKHCAQPSTSSSSGSLMQSSSVPSAPLPLNNSSNHLSNNLSPPADAFAKSKGGEVRFSDGSSISKIGRDEFQGRAENRENVDFWKKRLGSR